MNGAEAYEGDEELAHRVDLPEHLVEPELVRYAMHAPVSHCGPVILDTIGINHTYIDYIHHETGQDRTEQNRTGQETDPDAR